MRPCGSRPEPKLSSAKRNPRWRRPPARIRTCGKLAATSSVAWKQTRCGSARVERMCPSSHSTKVASRAVSFESRTKRHCGRRCAAKASEAPTTQRSMFFSRSLRSAAAMNSDGSTSLPCGIDHADQHVPHLRVIALQARHRLLRQAEPVLHERGLDVLDPHLIVRLDAVLDVGPPGCQRLVAALLDALGASLDGIGHDGVELGFAGRHDRQAHRARDRDRLLVDAHEVLLHARQELFAPRLNIVLVAALEQREEPHATEAPDDLVGIERLLAGASLIPISTSSLAVAPTSRSTAANASSLISARQRMPPGLGRREARMQRLHQLASMEEAGRMVRMDRVAQLLDEILLIAGFGGHHQAHARLAVVVTQRQHDLHGHRACRPGAGRSP